MTDKVKKQKKTFTMRQEIFTKLKIFSARRNIPYGIIIEALVDTYLDEPTSFPEVEFSKYK